MFVLRPYQLEAVNSVMRDIDEGKKKLAIIASVSAGKTVMFSAISKQYTDTHPEEIVLILSHLSILTTQTLNRLNKDFPTVDVGIMQADVYPTKKCDVIISTMQSSRDNEKIERTMKFQSNFGKKKIGLIIVDEMHMILNNSYQKIIKDNPEAVTLGVTATPWKDGYLISNFFDKVSYQISTQKLIDEGYLVPPNLIGIETPEDCDDAFKKALVMKTYLEKENGKQAVVFMKTIQDANEMATVFKDHGISAMAITKDVTGEPRDKLLDDFRERKIKVLTSVNVLTAGFDAPCIDAIFMPYATKSPTTYMQRIGRGLRKYEGKVDCRIYYYGDTPSIKRGFYLNEEATNEDKTKIKETDIFEDLQDLIDSGVDDSEYEWTQTICNIAEKVRKLSATALYEMIRVKKFPKRFLHDINLFYNNIPDKQFKSTEPVTEPQKKLLLQNGFLASDIDKMTKADASVMIGTIINIRNDSDTPDYIVKSGKYTGKHVKDLPYFYKNVILSKYSNSHIANQIRGYESKNNFKWG